MFVAEQEAGTYYFKWNRVLYNIDEVAAFQSAILARQPAHNQPPTVMDWSLKHASVLETDPISCPFLVSFPQSCLNNI